MWSPPAWVRRFISHEAGRVRDDVHGKAHWSAEPWAPDFDDYSVCGAAGAAPPASRHGRGFGGISTALPVAASSHIVKYHLGAVVATSDHGIRTVNDKRRATIRTDITPKGAVTMT